MAGLIDFGLLGAGVDYGQIARAYTDGRAQKADRQLREAEVARQTKADARTDKIDARDDAQRAAFSAAVDPTTGKLDPEKARLAYAQSGDAKGLLEFEKSQAAASKAQREDHLQQLSGLAQLTGMAVDQPSYEKAISDAKAQGYDVSSLSPQFDPAQVEKMRYAVLDAKDRIEIELKQDEARRKVADTEADNKRSDAQLRETMRSNRVGEGQRSQSLSLQAQGNRISAANGAAGGKAPSGYRWGPNNSLVAIPGGPADVSATGGKPLTEAQSKATGYYGRALMTDKIISGGKNIPGSGARFADNLPLGVGSAFISSDDQTQLGARRGFIASILRQESGAAISPSEFASYDNLYFPQPNDSKENIAQKARLRAQAVRGLAVAAGPGAAQMAAEPSSPPPPKAPPPPKGGFRRGQTATGPNGQRIVFDGRQWKPANGGR